MRAERCTGGSLAEFPFDVEARNASRPLTHGLALRGQNLAASGAQATPRSRTAERPHVWSSLGETYLRLGERPRSSGARSLPCSSSRWDPFGYHGSRDSLNSSPAIRLRPTPPFCACPRAGARIRAARGSALAQTQVLQDEWGRLPSAMLRALVADREAPAVSRIDAAFDLSSLLRAEGRFASSLEPLREA